MSGIIAIRSLNPPKVIHTVLLHRALDFIDAIEKMEKDLEDMIRRQARTALQTSAEAGAEAPAAPVNDVFHIADFRNVRNELELYL